MQVVVLEPDLSGHRYNFARVLVRALLDRGVDVALAIDITTLPIALDQYDVLDASGVEIIELDLAPRCGRKSVLGQAAGRLRCLRQVLKSQRSSRILIPSADGLAQVSSRPSVFGLAERRGIAIDALILKSAYPYLSERVALRTRICARASFRAAIGGAWNRLFFLDPTLHAAAVQTIDYTTRQCIVMPDPIPGDARVAPKRARTRLGIPAGGPYVGLVGAINARKGADLLVETYASSKALGSARLLLAGPHDRKLREMLGGPYEGLVRNGHIVSRDEFLSDEELHLAICSLSLVVAPYPAHYGSASIVLRANALGLPVLGSDIGWMGWAIPEFGLGMAADVTDSDAFRAALEDGIGFSHTYRRGSRALDFALFHTESNFVAHWLDGIPSGEACEPGARPYRWEEVIGGRPHYL